LFIYTDVFIEMWVGPRFLAGVPVIRILAVAIPFYLVYCSLRSLVDAASHKSFNAVNSTIALVVFCVIVGLQVNSAPSNQLIVEFAFALLLALVLLAILTTFSVQVLFKLRPDWSELCLSSVGAAVCGALGWFVRWRDGYSLNAFSSLIAIAISSVLFIAYLFYIRTPWLMFLASTLFSPKEPQYKPSSSRLEVAEPHG